MSHEPFPQHRASFGSFIRERRKELDLTQTQLGRAVGVDQTTISTWEAGKSRPSDLHGLAEAIGVSPAALADQAFGILTDVERAIVADPHLSKEKQDILLAVYGVLTNRPSQGNGQLLRDV